MSEPGKALNKPQTGVEKALIAIWSQALGIKSISQEDNFFALGGNASLALLLVEQIRTYLGIEIPADSIIENPTVRELAQCLQSANKSSGNRTATAQAKRTEYRASFAQVRLWLQYNLEPDSPAYNLFNSFVVRGKLNRGALEEAIRALMRRHESLRTVFYSGQEGELLQRVGEPQPAIAYEDLKSYSGPEQEFRLRQLVEADVRRPFVLENGPLFRCLLIALSPERHVLVLIAHHIISDGWSQQVMIAELAQLYHAIAKGLPPPLPELKMQYGEFAEWQREWLSGAEWERQSSYWKAQLAGAPELLSLPTDYPRGVDSGSSPAGVYRFALGEELSSRLRSLSLASGATLYMTLLAGFQALISRYCWQDDLCIASPVANRALKETEELIGFFVNTQILRSNLEDNPPFSNLLGRTRQIVLEALDHLALPFDEIVSMLRPQRFPGSTPYAQVMFSLQNIPSRLPESGDLIFEPVTLAAGIPKFDLSLVLEEKSGGQEITGYFSFRGELFEQATIERMAKCYAALLNAAVDDAACPVFQLQILSSQEKKHVLEEWNRPATFASWPAAMAASHGVAEISAQTTAVTTTGMDERASLAAMQGSITHARAYILDRYLQPVPPGAMGELYLDEKNFVLGNGPNDDQNAWVQNPFGQGSLYPTYQLAHNLSDGRIEVTGKPGERRKGRSQEVNAAGIQSALEQHPDVSQCAVAAGQNAITCYVAPRAEARPDVDRLRAELRNMLAGYAASSILVFVPALLWDSDGRPDFAGMAESIQAGEHAAHLTPVQKILLDIWRGVLGVKGAGIHDNFFDLGGNSLLAVRVAAEARQHGLHFASRELFRHQTIADLASTVKLPQAHVDPVLAGDKDWWPTSPIQRWFFDRNFFNPTLWNMATLFKANSAIDLHLLRLAAEQLVHRHVALRLQFLRHKEEWVQRVMEKSDDIFHSFDLSHLDFAAQRAELARLGTQLQSSFRFNEGTLIRFGFFNLGSQGARLLIAAHHLVCDGFSMNVVMEDLASIYAGLSSPERLPARDAGSSFLEWTLLVHSPAVLAQVITEGPYWAPRKHGGLPLDFPDGKNLVASVQRLRTELTQSETSSLLALAREKYHASMEVLLLWGVANCLMDWKNERFAVLTMLGHGRENEWAHLDLSRTVGYFTVHYPLVVEIPPDLGREDSVEEVRRQLDAVPNQGIGYGVLRFIYNEKYPDRSVPLQEEGDISFNYLGNYDLNLAPQGLFSIASEKIGAGREAQADNPYRFGYFGHILNGKLHTEWWFNTALHKVETIQAVADSFQQKLRSLLTA
jgi:non-ribosomal peptide synthase protein (TIGR01720 family)